MEPPRGILSSLWNFICFLPYFIGLLILGFLKGIILCPIVCLIMTIGNTSIILGLWLLHFFYTFYSLLRCKILGPVLKLVYCPCILFILVVWLPIGIIGSFVSSAIYGLLAPVFATFKAIGEGKTNKFFHCFYDGTWDTVKETFTGVRDFKDVCLHSYLSFMEELQSQKPTEGNYYEIRLLYLFGAIVAGVLGFMVDFLLISLIAFVKSPYMLFKGWHRLFQDCIGREGPFLETFCVPFAGLAIILWPLAVAGAVLGSMTASIFQGGYAAVIVYQESSLWMGLCYIVATLSIYDEYSNDILDMPEGSCFPRPKYRKKTSSSAQGSRASSFSRPGSFRGPPSRTSSSVKVPMVELKPLELLDCLLKECKYHGEQMVTQGVITLKDVEDAKLSKDGGNIISNGLPAYSLLRILVRSANSHSVGIVLDDNLTEITSTNRAKDVFWDWFLNPLLIIKDQIKATDLSEEEEDYLDKLVLLSGDNQRMKKYTPPQSEQKRAELDALARRLRGITKSISRYPTFRRRFDESVKSISEDLSKKREEGLQIVPRSRSVFIRMFSQKRPKYKTGDGSTLDQDSESVTGRRDDVADVV
ncbi:uncharacterized membrane protein At3g27390-like [Impatiens glandulifera]|uniref:uncharacterized membrane protein At3g27390-like n=1 Tax=Impatiens glandulifera TaxID=253017 RepID=UPI001FB179EF|nr:uncharacterized membrane protein At3g27390-like [Impatiens glandulifera]